MTTKDDEAHFEFSSTLAEADAVVFVLRSAAEEVVRVTADGGMRVNPKYASDAAAILFWQATQSALRVALAQEREACARIADARGVADGSATTRVEAQGIADAIRSRGEIDAAELAAPERGASPAAVSPPAEALRKARELLRHAAFSSFTGWEEQRTALLSDLDRLLGSAPTSPLADRFRAFAECAVALRGGIPWRQEDLDECVAWLRANS